MLKAQYIQLSFFSPESQLLKADRLFQELFLMEADLTQSNKTPTPDTPFFSMASASDGDVDFRVHVNPGRLDISVSPKTQGQGVPLLDPLEYLMRLRSSIIRGSFKDVRFNRASVIVQLMQILPTQSDVTDFLLKQSGLDKQFSAVSDLILQLNKRKSFKSLSDREMNRLITLNETVFQKMHLEFTAPHIAPRPVGINEWGAGTLIDVNSAPNPAFIPHKAVVSVMEELIDEASLFASSEEPFSLLRR